ncbi:hypothetical protein B6N60_03780 [Richelia sinica FACHB-800]|uniref:Uncharacterized protein n=1 Tax=Richelia sinica FACHB-800 TaxID=1357546 RepID=A0A975TAU8_9NOST|nr:hypothetical protein B6N60_03780 [Richelia sinica FACHB-800]
MSFYFTQDKRQFHNQYFQSASKGFNQRQFFDAELTANKVEDEEGE